MDFMQDNLLSKRAKEIFKLVLEKNESMTFQQILSDSTGSRSTVRFAVCELVDVGYLKVRRGFDKEVKRNQVYYVVNSDDPSQENFWK